MLLLVAGAALGGCAARATNEPAPPVASVAPSTPQPSYSPPLAATSFDRHQHSLTDPGSIWVIVNKSHPIRPSDFRPDTSIVRGYRVATIAAEPLARLLDAADAARLPLKITSAFRSYDYQHAVHAQVVGARGTRGAEAISARPGHSEHQTGLAVDLQPLDGRCALDACFAGTPEGRWLADHAWEYGFIVRYTRANQDVTGYGPEPWHFRYVGRSLAQELRESGVGSVEQYFSVPGGPYPD